MKSSDILLILNEIPFSIDYKYKKDIVIFLSNKKINTFINPMSIVHKFEIEEKLVFLMMSILVNKSILKDCYKVICPKCKHVSSEVFESFAEIEKSIGCELCETEYSKDYKYLILIYKLIKEIK